MSRRRGWTTAVALGLILGAASCGPAPLDEGTARTGGPLTDNQQATDVLRYELTLEVLPGKRTLRGVGRTVLQALEPIDHVELQLDERLDVPEILVDGTATSFTRDRGTLRIDLPESTDVRRELTVDVRYEGRPWVARNAPWDGGIVWSQTDDGQPWIATAVQGEGCDLWWPCKDHFADKPNRIDLHVTVPADLSAVLNGRLHEQREESDGRRTFHWALDVPTADYNVSLNVGPFVRIERPYPSINGEVFPIEFWALPEHEDEARQLIEDDLVHQLAWYERTLGPYPWGGEKLGIVETPHLGMEHQTINAYGNEFKRDDHGFDWLLQHELAHEWFGNLMTHATLADAWLHEGFGMYMQPAYSRWRDGEAAYHHRMYEAYLDMKNCDPVVPDEIASDEAFQLDIYVKGAWTLHTLRWLIGDEAFWRATRRLLYDTADPWSLTAPIAPRYRTTAAFERIVAEEAGRDLDWLFDAYLREADLPRLDVQREGPRLSLRWVTPGEGPFPLEVPVQIDGVVVRVAMPDGAATVDAAESAHVIVDPQMQLLRRLPIIGTCEEIEAEEDAETDD